MNIKIDIASRVLADAEIALQKFDENPIDVEFRHLVFLSITLIRAVGNVVYSENIQNPESRIKLENYYDRYIKDKRLFRNFIKGTRDSAVKEYKTYIGWASITTIHNERRMEYLFLSGENEGKDFRDLMKKSIIFWKYHLKKMSLL